MQLDLEAKQQFQQKFTILNLLGKGSFGFVYECIDAYDNQLYAVKVISKNNVKKSKIDCLREQAKILSTIDHPNIVKVYEFVELATCIFLKMEIVKGGTLQQLIKKRWESGQKFTDEQASTIMASLFRSVNHIHSVSIIHRDIKPGSFIIFISENILIPNEKQLDKIKMADFGLSTKLDFHYPKTATSKCGTMLYMAPQILCNYTYTKSVDIWSISIIMYMLFNGKHPFFLSKMTTDDYKRKIKVVKFPSLSNKLAQDFINKISKVEANERYSAQQALKHPWLTRNLDDDIPLSLHESFSGFEKSHQISLLIKSFVFIKTFSSPLNNIKLPEEYIKLKNNFSFNQSSNTLDFRNTRSKKHLNTLNNLNITFQKQNNQKKIKQKVSQNTFEMQNDNPAIQKLNTIFDTLFGKRNKQKANTYTEGVTGIYQPRQYAVQVPDISHYKEKIEGQLERAVKEYKNTLKPNNRRILPVKHSNVKQQQRYLSIHYKQDHKSSDINKLSSSNLKNKYRRRICPSIKVH